MNLINFNKKNVCKILIIACAIVVAVLSFWLTVLPIIKYNFNYDVPSGMTAEETLKSYFEFLDDNNPAKANQLLYEPGLGPYSCNTLLSIRLDEIRELKVDIKLPECYDSKRFTTKFKCDYLLGYDWNKVFDKNTTFMDFYLIKKEKDSDWKIYSWGVG